MLFLLIIPSVSDHKPLIVFIVRKLPQMNHFCYQKKKKNMKDGIGINVLNKRKKFVITINFEILNEEIGNEELSIDCVIEKVY